MADWIGRELGPHPTPEQPERTRELNIWERQGEGAFMRFSAWFVDCIAIALLSSPVLLAIAWARGTNPLGLRPRDLEGLIASAALMAVPAVWLLYFTLLEGTFGTTLGKWIGARPLAVLRVVRKDGTRCGYGRAAVRALFGLLEGNPLGAIVIWATPLHQRIGDLVAGTLVVSLQKPLRLTFQDRHATFAFADGRLVAIDELLRGRVQKWINWNRMVLIGVTPEGRRVRLRGLAFPDAYKRGQVRDELERFFQVRIPERVQWWRLLPALVILAVGLAAAVGGALSAQQGRLPAWLPTRRDTALPTSTRLDAVKATPAAPQEPTPLPTLAAATPLPVQPRATPTRARSPTPTQTPHSTATAVIWAAQVRGDRVNLRAGPGTDYAVLNVLTQGTRLTASERNAGADWFHVQVEASGQVGWISITVVDLAFDPQEVPVADEIPPTPPQVATPVPATATPSASGPGAGPAVVHGRILWNGQPFADVTVKLCSNWQMFGGCQGVEFRATSGADGGYRIEGVSPGKYSFVTKVPGQSTETMWLGMSVEVQAGQTLAVRDVSVTKYDIRMTSPTGRTVVDTRTPTLVWEAYPGAASYKVYASGGPSSKTVADFVPVTTPQYTFPGELEPGDYHWSVVALNASGRKIAECASLSYFTVK